MKIKGTRIIALAVLISAIVLVVLKLKSNKQEFLNQVEFSRQMVDNIPVATEPVKKGILSENVVATGTLEASEVLTLVSETQGRIIRIYKEKGDRVSAGDIIAKVDDEVISANVLTAEANFEQFEKDIARLTRLSEENAVTRRDLEQAGIGLKKAKADLITAKKALSNTSIKSPISGYINNDFITHGQLLGGGSPVCEIVNNNKLKLNIKISEREVYKIKTGQSVAVHLTVFPDKQFTGKITSIAEKADAVLKFNVEITLDNDADAHLKSGLFAEVELPVTNEEELLISKSCIVGSMESPVVYLVQNGKALKRQLVIGHSNDRQVEVLNGLSDGDQVVASGQMNLKDGDAIKIIQ